MKEIKLVDKEELCMWCKYLLTTIITNNPDFKSNTSSFRSKRNLLVVKELYCTRVITKEAKIMNLRVSAENVSTNKTWSAQNHNTDYNCTCKHKIIRYDSNVFITAISMWTKQNYSPMKGRVFKSLNLLKKHQRLNFKLMDHKVRAHFIAISATNLSKIAFAFSSL